VKIWRKLSVFLLCVILALTAVGVVACNGDEEVDYQLEEVVRGDLSVVVSASGNLEAVNEAKLDFGSGGEVAEVYVKDGDWVNEGDMLAKLDTVQLELALAQAEASLAQAAYNLHQVRDVLHAAEDQVAVVESTYDAAVLGVEYAQRQLDKATIVAPFDGLVGMVSVEAGDIIMPPTAMPTTIVHLIDPSVMELKLEVDEIDIPVLRLNQQAMVEVDALPGLELEGVVTAIRQTGDVSAGLVTYGVTLEMDIPTRSGVMVGMSATADIIVGERSGVLLVSSRAINLNNMGNSVATVMVNDERQEKIVTTGLTDGYHTEIIAGLREGDMVVIDR